MGTTIAVMCLFVCIQYATAGGQGLALGISKRQQDSTSSSFSSSTFSTPASITPSVQDVSSELRASPSPTDAAPAPSTSSLRISTSITPTQTSSLPIATLSSISAESSMSLASSPSSSSPLLPSPRASSSLTLASNQSLSNTSTVRPEMTPSIPSTMITNLPIGISSFTQVSSVVVFVTDSITISSSVDTLLAPSTFPTSFQGFVGNATSVSSPLAPTPSLPYTESPTVSGVQGEASKPHFSTSLDSAPSETTTTLQSSSSYSRQTSEPVVSSTPVTSESVKHSSGGSILDPTSFSRSHVEMNSAVLAFSTLAVRLNTSSYSVGSLDATSEFASNVYRTIETQALMTAMISSSFSKSTTHDVTASVMPSTSLQTSPSRALPAPPSEMPASVSTVQPETTPESLEAYLPVRCTMTLEGYCGPVLSDRHLFIQAFTDLMSSLLSIDPSRLEVNNLACGSVLVDFTLQDTLDGDFSEDLEGIMDTRTIVVVFGGQNMTSSSFEFRDGPFASPAPTPAGDPTTEGPSPNDGGGGMAFIREQKLIFILIAVIVGSVIVLAIVLAIHHALRKACSKTQQSFELQDEPCIKLTDFNMAHTCIPRPRSIYSSIGVNGKFCRYDANEDAGHPPGSPTSSYTYANTQDIRDQYHEVVDHGHLENIPELDRSGLPDSSFPIDDGENAMVPSDADLRAIIDYHPHNSQPSTSSDALRPPSRESSTVTNNHPTFAPPAPPPPPPPPPLPTPVPPSGKAQFQQRSRCDASSESSESSDDTITLTKGGADMGTSMMCFDNPIITPEEDYDDPLPSNP